ncbi:MAG: hypothetical protein M5U25_04700 [Planctomycetota bacterium]|nr:hypothetical protein [Planctomycetota bacterium]
MAVGFGSVRLRTVVLRVDDCLEALPATFFADFFAGLCADFPAGFVVRRLVAFPADFFFAAPAAWFARDFLEAEAGLFPAGLACDFPRVCFLPARAMMGPGRNCAGQVIEAAFLHKRLRGVSESKVALPTGNVDKLSGSSFGESGRPRM